MTYIFLSLFCFALGYFTHERLDAWRHHKRVMERISKIRIPIK